MPYDASTLAGLPKKGHALPLHLNSPRGKTCPALLYLIAISLARLSNEDRHRLAGGAFAGVVECGHSDSSAEAHGQSGERGIAVVHGGDRIPRGCSGGLFPYAITLGARRIIPVQIDRARAVRPDRDHQAVRNLRSLRRSRRVEAKRIPTRVQWRQQQVEFINKPAHPCRERSEGGIACVSERAIGSESKGTGRALLVVE